MNSKQPVFILILLTILLTACTSESNPVLQPTSLPPTETPLPPLPQTLPVGEIFTVVDMEPVVPHGPEGSWDGQITDPGAVVYHDGLFNMFHNGFVGWPAPVSVGYSTSPDGITWTREQAEPVFTATDLDYVGLTMLASSALVEDDGTWVLYFYIWDTNSWPSSGSIGRATAPAPTGPWTADAQPILLPGSDGEWDDYALRAPSVVRTGSEYIIFYTGYTTRQGQIGMASSPDVINWTKYDDPATTAAPFAESDPVFMASEDGWDKYHVTQPRVQLTAEGWLMLYSGAVSVNGQGVELGYAMSRDGLNWVRATEPILEFKVIPGGNAIWYTELLHHDNVTYLYFEEGIFGQGTNVYVATHEGKFLDP